MENKPISSGVERVKQHLENHGGHFDVLTLPDSTHTAKDAANAIGCNVEQIAKSLVFVDKLSEQPIMIIASGTNIVSLDKVEEATGFVLGKATAKQVKTFTGFSIGGVSPIAHIQPIITVLDEDLKQYSEIWAAAGSPNSVFKLQSQQLQSLTQGSWLSLCQ